MFSRLFPASLVCLFRAIVIAAIGFSNAQAAAPKPVATDQTATGRKLAVAPEVRQGRRIALVIGNGAYHYSDSLPRLTNPTNDAEDIAAALRGFGFEVIERKNQTLEGMSDAITEFSRKIGDSEAALFYFAGHGLQVKGQNYLVPVDARIETEAQVAFKSINVNLILEELDNGKSRANIVMLDACRNNPISGKFRSGATRGLAAPTSHPKGTVIIYATDPGNVAADGEGRNGLFTAGLLSAFKGQDLSLHGVLVRASKEVERSSGQMQTPYVNGPMTLQESFHFGKGIQVAQLGPSIGGSARSAAQIEDELWDAIKNSGKERVFEEYLKQYPNGRYQAQARVKLAGLKSEAKPATVAVKPLPQSSSTVPAYSNDPDTALWLTVEQGNSADDYDVYLKQYPKGKYVALAKQRSLKLKEEALQRAESAQAQAKLKNMAEQEITQEAALNILGSLSDSTKWRFVGEPSAYKNWVKGLRRAGDRILMTYDYRNDLGRWTTGTTYGDELPGKTFTIKYTIWFPNYCDRSDCGVLAHYILEIVSKNKVQVKAVESWPKIQPYFEAKTQHLTFEYIRK